MPAIAETAAFYPFIKMQNPEEGKAAEDAYNWIMGSDSAEATKRLTKVLGLAKSQVGDNPQAKMMIVNMLKAGLNTKMAVLKADPQNAELHKQIEMINNTIEAYSK